VIDSKFVDVRFDQDPRYVMGNLGDRDDGHLCRAFSDAALVIPEDRWPDLAAEMDANNSGLDALVTRIYDQKQEGSCVANASAQAMEIIQAVQFGKDRVIPLSAISLYKRIGRSASSGAFVGDGITELCENGILPLDTPENREKFKHVMPNTGFREPFPEGWETTGELFLAVEFLKINHVAELISALYQRFPVVVGREGHSICYVRPKYEDGDLMAKYANSWGDWGDNGYGYDTLKQIKKCVGPSVGTYALRAIVTPDFQKPRRAA
jgi:hypothetical protein